MKMKIIILILFCLIGFLCCRWAKTISNEINEPIKIECKGGICPVPLEYEEEGGK